MTRKLGIKLSAAKNNRGNFHPHFANFTLGNESFLEEEKYLVKIVES